MRGLVREAIEALRTIQDEAELLARIYVVDSEGIILGKVRLHDLTFANPSDRIGNLNDGDTRAVLATADQEKAVRVMVTYGMLALPVVDDDGRTSQALRGDRVRTPVGVLGDVARAHIRALLQLDGAPASA